MAIKNILPTLASIALCFSTWAAPAYSQRSLAFSLYNSGVKAYDKGNYREALRILRQCQSTIAQTRHSQTEESELLYSLGETLRCVGQLKEAEETVKQSLAIMDTLPRGKRYYLFRFNALALIYQSQGKFTEAEGLWKQAEQYARSGDPNLVFPVNNLAHHYFLWGKVPEEKECVERTITLAKNSPKSIAVPFSLLNQAQLDEQLGNYRSAEEKYKAAFNSCSSLFGASHPYCGLILMNMSDLFRKESRYTDAENILREALKIFESQYPPEHPDIADTMVKLARVLCDEGKYSQAKALVQTALKNEEDLLQGSPNLIIAKAKNCLGNIARQDGRYGDALKLIQESIDIQKRILGGQNIELAVTMRDLALVQEEEGEFEAAEDTLLNSMHIIERLAGPEHPERAAAASALAHAYLRDQKYADAEPMLKKSMELSEKVLGNNNAVTASGAHDLGSLYLQQKQFTEAQQYLSKALSIDEALYGQSAAQVAADLTILATAVSGAGDEIKASDLLKRAAQIKNVLPGGNRSENAIVAFKANPTVDRPVGEKWALVIGISNFKDSSINLKFAAKDATDFKNFLVNKENFKADHVKLLTDESATRENIIGLMGDKWLASHVKPDDMVIVYVSSHGSEATDKAGGTNFLIAYDTNKNSLAATGIPMQWLTSIVSEQVHSDRIILILDVCHSGAAGQGQKGLSRAGGIDPSALSIGKGQMVLCSSLANQVSWESKNYENSVFTRCLIEALQSKEGQSSMLEAYKRLRILVEAEVLRDRGDIQTPLLNNSQWLGKDPSLSVAPASAN